MNIFISIYNFLQSPTQNAACQAKDSHHYSVTCSHYFYPMSHEFLVFSKVNALYRS